MLYATVFLILWMAYWSAESGASLPWSQKWQDKVDWFSEIPEAVFALTIAGVSTYGWCLALGWTGVWPVLGWLLGLVVAYVGQQSATWAYLRWTGHRNPDTDRTSTLRPFNDWLAGLFGYRLGDEGYSWVWAATKGAIITAPLGFTGLVTFPLGHEVGSHAKGRLPGDPNMWKELISGAAIGVSCALFLWYII
jgi:hypothetical protein